MQTIRVLLCCVIFTLLAFGQSNYGVITGIVSDLQHLRVTSAAIQLNAAGTGAVRHVVTNEQGLFEAPALLPDDYELTIEAPGFAHRPRRCGWKSARSWPWM
jgi:hypothetical protein